MATVDRVLPWRRHQNVTGRRADAAADAPTAAATRRRRWRMINRAYETAARGPPPPVRAAAARATSTTRSRWPGSWPTSASTRSRWPRRCCTTPSRTPRSRVADVEAGFGAEVAAIVDGVTKLERHPVRLEGGAAGRHDAQDAGGDGHGPAGADHQARRPAAQHAHHRRRCRSEKQQRIAQETLDIYAPLAHRLGMQEMKQQLEDLVVRRRSTRSATPSSTTSSAPARPSARCTSPRRSPRCRAACTSSASRPRSPVAASTCGASTRRWSQKGREFDDIFDLVAIRVIVDSVKDCYAALGCIHGR